MGVYNGEPIGHNAVRPTGESAWCGTFLVWI